MLNNIVHIVPSFMQIKNETVIYLTTAIIVWRSLGKIYRAGYFDYNQVVVLTCLGHFDK